MRLSTWLRQANTKGLPRITYAEGHPAYLNLMRQTMAAHATDDHSLLHIPISSPEFSSVVASSVPYKRFIVCSLHSDQDLERLYSFLRHSWDRKLYPKDSLLFYTESKHQNLIDLTKDKFCYVPAGTQTETETSRIVSLMLGKPPEAVVEYFIGKVGLQPLNVIQTLKTLALVPRISKRSVDFSVYDQGPVSFELSMFKRDFSAGWALFESMSFSEKISAIHATYAKYQTLSYVKREQPKLSYQRDSFSGTPFVLLQEAYTFVPHYTDSHLTQIESALLQSFSLLPKFPDRAIISLLTMWPK